jgi:hypothetical protein
MPYRPAVYLAAGGVVHVRCHGAVRGAAHASMAIIRPTSHALRLRARERRAAATLQLAEIRRSRAGLAPPGGQNETAAREGN